jgi:glycosyltransferase involved in cell wall biosynthesis
MAASTAANRRRWWTGIARFFCISAAQRDLLVSAGMPGERMAVKHNFVTDPGVRRTGDGKHVLFLGRVTEEKGVGLLMRAWDRLGGALGIPLVIAGTGPMQDEVATWAARRADVSYVGLQNKAECRALTADAVAVVAPSTWLEAFGLVVVEAMAAGVPTVAASHGAFPELVDDGVTGLLHAPNNADSLADRLQSVVGDRNREMGDAARVRYEKDFTPAVGLDRLITGYEAAIEARG